MLLKNKLRILGKAVWEVIKFPLLGLGIATFVSGTLISLIYFFGFGTALKILFGLFVVGVLCSFVYDKYHELMKKYLDEERKIMDTLRR